jgi:iron complex outermembrane receptor protein
MIPLAATEQEAPRCDAVMGDRMSLKPNPRSVLAGLLVSTTMAPVAFAQEAPGVTDISQVVVTGTRAANHTELDSSVPISVYSGREVREAVPISLGEALETLSPAINFGHSSTSGSVANTRIITIDGLQSDEELVLVNGKRYPLSASFIFNNSPGRGSAPYDIAGIPKGAIDHVEILQDGAASQYGSDAIAGVVNIILRHDSSGGSASAQTGVTEVSDGWNIDVTGTQGFQIAGEGHLTLTADVRHQEITNRAGVNTSLGRVVDVEGEPLSTDESFALDAARPLNASWDVYGFAMFSHRDSVSPATYRAATGSTASPLYPAGYLAHIGANVWDGDAAAGVRGTVGGGVELDLSNTFGFSRVDFTALDTANVQLGLASPTSFNSGGEQYIQDVANLTATKELPKLLAGGLLAAGAEYRYEGYKIIRGEPNSYFGSGAQGFPGLNPRLPVDAGRSAASVYVDGEIKPVARLSLELSGRYDHYSDFGDATTGKVSGRYDLTDWIAVRGSASNGFKAPSLQQQYFSSVTAGLAGTTLVNIGTYQVNDPIAVALGSKPLKAEQSRHFGAGMVLRPLPALSITADWFLIDIDHRIVLSDRLTGAAVAKILAAAGITNVQQAQFVTNAASTRTEGCQFSVDYHGRIDSQTNYAINVGFVSSPTSLRSLAPNTAIPALPLIGDTSKHLLINAQPQNKLTSSLTLDHGPISARLGVVRYGHWVADPSGVLVQTFSAKTLVDLSLSGRITQNLVLTAGVENLGDVYPDKLLGAVVATGYIYGDESPFGVSGRSYFVRLDARF